jgi:hypothetical protein
MSDIEVTVTTLRGSPESVAETLRRLGLDKHVPGNGVASDDHTVAQESASRSSDTDRKLINAIAKQFRRLELSENQKGLLDLCEQNPDRFVSIEEASVKLKTERIRLGGAVGGLGLRFQEIARDAGIRRNPIQVVLQLAKVQGVKAYRFTPNGLAGYREAKRTANL